MVDAPAGTARLCQTTTTAARAGVRMDSIGSRGCGWTVRRTHRRELVDQREGSRRVGAVTAEVEAPFDHVDIAQWLKTLPTHEYQRCAPPDHKAAGYTVDDDGTPMSINVEMIGTGLVVQQYRFEAAEPQYCKMVSLSDVLTPLGWTSTQVIWELRIEQLDGDRCRYTNTVTSHPTDAVVPLRA